MEKQFSYFKGVVNSDFMPEKISSMLTTGNQVIDSRVLVFITGHSGTGKSFLAELMNDIMKDCLDDSEIKGFSSVIHLDKISSWINGKWMTDIEALKSLIEATRVDAHVIYWIEGISHNREEVAEAVIELTRKQDLAYAMVVDSDAKIFIDANKLKHEELVKNGVDVKSVAWHLKNSKLTVAGATKFLKDDRLWILKGLKPFKNIYLLRNIKCGDILSGWHEKVGSNSKPDCHV